VQHQNHRFVDMQRVYGIGQDCPWESDKVSQENNLFLEIAVYILRRTAPKPSTMDSSQTETNAVTANSTLHCKPNRGTMGPGC
jgi:hypothetical protein